MKILIKDGRVIDPDSNLDETLDILIQGKKIADIKSNIDIETDHIVNASKYVVAPGFIDMHVHFREPGQEEKETIRSGSFAAARGGFTSVCCMPNTNPVNDERNVTEFIVNKAKTETKVNVFPIAAITKGLNGEFLTDLSDLKRAGALGFSDDGHPVSNSMVMRRALEYSLPLNTLIIDHCEDKDLSNNGVMHEGYHSNKLGLKGIPGSSEDVMIARNIILAEHAEARIHIAHLSTKGGVDLVRRAKEKKIAVSAEVTPHHLILTDSSIRSYDTNLKVNPPLRSQEDVNALISALQDDIIDVFATDHAPHTPDEKSVDFAAAPFGIIGLESAVSLLLDKIVHNNIISLTKFIAMYSTHPARLLGLENKGKLCSGADADLTLLNINKKTTIDKNMFFSKGKNCPFDGWQLKGTPVMTIVGGNIVYPTDYSEQKIG